MEKHEKSNGTSPTAVIVGVGEGLGAALARRFASGYRVAVVARRREVIGRLCDEINAGGSVAKAFPGDATIPEEVERTYQEICGNFGAPRLLIYNGGRRPFGTVLDTSPEVFEQTWRTHAFGAFLWARQVVPAMLAHRDGAVLITGATAGVKPGASSAAFGPAKFAARGLAQVLSRDLHPQRVHVAYVNIDGVIDTPFVRQAMPHLTAGKLMKSSAIADAYWHLAHQDPSSWSHELDLRPCSETF